MNELIFDDYISIKQSELNTSMITFLSRILNINENITWNNEAVSNIVNIAIEELKNHGVDICNPKYITKDNIKVPCYKCDYCKYSNCIFKK